MIEIVTESSELLEIYGNLLKGVYLQTEKLHTCIARNVLRKKYV